AAEGAVRAGGPAGRLAGSGGARRVQVPSTGDALQRVVTAIVELDSRPRDQVPDGAGDQDLARPGDPQHPCPDVDRDADQLAAAFLALARVNARPDVQADPAQVLADGHRALAGAGRAAA